MSLFKILKGDSSRISLEETPFHDGWCYYTSDDGGFYIDSEDNGVQKRTRINPTGTKSDPVLCTLSANKWNSNKQTIDVKGLKAEQNGIIGVTQDITSTQLDAVCAAKLNVCAQGTGTLTIAVNGVVPTCDIPVVVVLLP